MARALLSCTLDGDKADIVIEVRPGRERKHLLQDGVEELIGRKGRVAMERGEKSFLAELLSFRIVHLKDSVCEKHDAIATFERSASGRKRRGIENPQGGTVFLSIRAQWLNRAGVAANAERAGVA